MEEKAHKRKAYGLTKPCAKCPFRSDIRPYLRSDRVRDIQQSLVRAEFPCHETTWKLGAEEGDKGEYVPSGKEMHCAGALILLEKLEQPSQMMRICERLGMYDRSKLDMNAPVYDSFEDMADAQDQEEHRLRKSFRLSTPTPKLSVDSRKQQMDAPLNSRAALLQVLLSGPGYGTELAARVKERSLGVIVLLQGSLYPMLRAFEDEGFVTSKKVDRSEDQRGGRQLIVYEMTKAGREQALKDRALLATMIEAQPIPKKKKSASSGANA